MKLSKLEECSREPKTLSVWRAFLIGTGRNMSPPIPATTRQEEWMTHSRKENLYFCHRKKIPVNDLDFCRKCKFRKRCESYQRYLQPDLPLNFNPKNYHCSILESQDHVKESLENLMPWEYKSLERKALSRLPKGNRNSKLLLRIKMFEILVNS